MNKKITAVLFGIIICIGISGYCSLEGFIKPVGRQILFGYERNAMPEGTGAYERVINVKNNIEQSFNNIYPKFVYIELNGLVQGLTGKRMVIDADSSKNIVKLDNNYLTFLHSELNNIDVMSGKVIDLDTYLKQKSIGLIYVEAPSKISKYNKGLPAGADDYSNENTDEFLSLIAHAGVDYIDLRQEMYDEKINQYDMFFKTDHHWTPEAGLWSFGKVSEKLNAQYGFNIDKELYNAKNYNYQVKKDWFLGSHGKRVGTFYAGVDDITVITPKFETNLILNIPSKKIERTGTFENTIFVNSQIEKKNYYNSNPYAAYIGGDFPLVTIQNTCVSVKKVLLVRDSFASVFAPFMALGCRELDAIDLRHYEDSSLMQYIDETDPDMVLFLYNPSRLSDMKTFTFDHVYSGAAADS